MPSDADMGRYGDVALQVGLGLRAGDRLLIHAPIQSAEFTRMVVESAYEAGAHNVDVLWSDDAVSRARFSHGTRAASEVVDGVRRFTAQSIGEYDCALQVLSDDPNLLAGQDQERVAVFQKKNNEHVKEFVDYVARLQMSWCVLSVPNPVWATAVFPDRDTDDAVEAMWEAILRTCYIDRDDPIEAWRRHLAQLAARSDYLNSKAYVAVHYRGPGTDLKLGLPDGHVWLGGSVSGSRGTEFVVNLPTEEVFTAPHRLQGEGVVTAAKPLSLFGSLIEEFTLEVAEGKIVAATAKRGQEVLDRALAIDEGAVRFGEVALVPQSSAVADEGLVWQNTLFDENDASHIAFGTAYPVSIRGGAGMTAEQRREAGLNDSAIHVDFVVGSDRLDIHGLNADGSEELILSKGEWAPDG